MSIDRHPPAGARPLVIGFTRDDMAALHNGLAGGYTFKELGVLLGRSQQSLRRYDRVFDMYGANAFPKG